jgi:type I restriction enzyme M protein
MVNVYGQRPATYRLAKMNLAMVVSLQSPWEHNASTFRRIYKGLTFDIMANPPFNDKEMVAIFSE